MEKAKKGYLEKFTEFSKAVYDGFVLKPGYFYGVNYRGQPIATSTYVKDGKLALYKKEQDHWVPDFIPVAEAIALYPTISSVLAEA